MSYLIFSGDKHYAQGGFNDFEKHVNTWEEVQEYVDNFELDCFKWYHIIDDDNLCCVASSDGQAFGAGKWSRIPPNEGDDDQAP
jgi:hypothetical protein